MKYTINNIIKKGSLKQHSAEQRFFVISAYVDHIIISGSQAEVYWKEQV